MKPSPTRLIVSGLIFQTALWGGFYFHTLVVDTWAEIPEIVTAILLALGSAYDMGNHFSSDE